MHPPRAYRHAWPIAVAGGVVGALILTARDAFAIWWLRLCVDLGVPGWLCSNLPGLAVIAVAWWAGAVAFGHRRLAAILRRQWRRGPGLSFVAAMAAPVLLIGIVTGTSTLDYSSLGSTVTTVLQVTAYTSVLFGLLLLVLVKHARLPFWPVAGAIAAFEVGTTLLLRPGFRDLAGYPFYVIWGAFVVVWKCWLVRRLGWNLLIPALADSAVVVARDAFTTPRPWHEIAHAASLAVATVLALRWRPRTITGPDGSAVPATRPTSDLPSAGSAP